MLEDISGETPFTQSAGVSDSYRWFAPELCLSAGSLSIQSDIYSFGMTVLEVNYVHCAYIAVLLTYRLYCSC
jgi:hypothetical protein